MPSSNEIEVRSDGFSGGFFIMEKEGFYFPHFSNARHDRKIKRLRLELGIEGYGIYFMLLETLRDQHDLCYPMQDIDLLADEFGTSEQKVRVVVCNYGLFDVSEDNSFFSPRLLIYLEPYFKAKQQRIEAGKASALKRQLNDRSTTVQQSKVKESKENEKKENESKLNETKEDFFKSEFFLSTFEKLWISYGRKGSKQKSLLEAKKLNNEDLKNFLESEDHIIAYVESTQEEPKFRKDFERYISNKYWESDIFKNQKVGKIGKTMQLYNNLINKDF